METNSHGITFDTFMRRVNGEIRDLCGLTSDDLGDFMYRDAFDAGVSSPHEIAIEVLADNGFPFGDENA